MKKAALFILFFIYLFSTTGVAVNVHYCGGKIADVSFSYAKKDTCPCGSKKMKKDCCKDKKHFFKLNETHKAGSDARVNLSSVLLPVMISPLVFHLDSQPAKQDSIYLEPPYPIDLEVYLINRNFRI